MFDINTLLLVILVILAIVIIFVLFNKNKALKNLESSYEEIKKEKQDLNTKNDRLSDQMSQLFGRFEENNSHINKFSTHITESQQRGVFELKNQLNEVIEFHKTIDSLTKNVTGLNDLLQNRQARGAYSEVILENLVSSILPPKFYSFQQTLSNNSRVDCSIMLQHDNNKLMCVDSKFPLDSYQKFVNEEGSLADFKKDMKKHIKDIGSKYIIHGETYEWALMFLPSEVIFSFIHSSSDMEDVVKYANENRVALVSPTTMMPMLYTIHNTIKDYTLNKKTIKVRDAINTIFKDYKRFFERFDKVESDAKRINNDIEELMITKNKLEKNIEKLGQFNLEDIEDMTD